ncbi:MAG TPA: hypothetical protein VGI39_11100 [Polyangiaceae bacterium]
MSSAVDRWSPPQVGGGSGGAWNASVVRAEYTSVAPAFTMTATPSASVIS